MNIQSNTNYPRNTGSFTLYTVHFINSTECHIHHHTTHSTFSLDTLYDTLFIRLDSPLHIDTPHSASHFTLYTWQSTVHTLHLTLVHNSHSNFSTLLCTPHFILNSSQPASTCQIIRVGDGEKWWLTLLTCTDTPHFVILVNQNNNNDIMHWPVKWRHCEHWVQASYHIITLDAISGNISGFVSI